MPESFGARLRKQREARHIDLSWIAEETKIKRSLLEALERDDVSRWPSGIFRRAYVRTYAHVVVQKRKRVRVPEAFTARFTLRGPGLDASFTLTDDRRIRGQRNGTPFTGRCPPRVLS